MSYIKRLDLTNFKGHTGSVDLSPVTMITGDNFKGKSRLREAIIVALLNYLPALGKRGGDTMQLASGDRMSVVAGFGDDSSIERAFHLERGAVKNVSPNKDPLVSPMMIDASEYFSLSGPDRTAYVLNNCAAGTTLTDDELRAGLRTAINQGVAEPSEHTEAALQQVMDKVTAAIEARESEDATIAQFLGLLVTGLKERVSELTAQIKGLAGHGQTSVTMRAAEAPVQDRAAELEFKRKERDGMLLAIQALDKLTEDKGLKERNQKRKAAATALIVLKSNASDIQVLREGIERLRPLVFEDDQRRTVDAQTPLNQVAAIESGNAAARQLIAELEHQLSIGDIKNAKQLKAVCPCCEETGDKCKMNRKLSKAWEKDRSHIETKLAILKIGIDQSADHIKEAKRLATERQHEANILAGHAQDLDAYTARLATYEATEAAYTAAKQRVTDLGPFEEEPVLTQNQTDAKLAAQLRMKEIEKEIAGLEHNQRQLVAQKQDAKRQEESRQRMAATESSLAVFKLALKAAEVAQQKFVSDAMTGFVEHARAFTDGILLSNLESLNGEIGRIVAGRFVGHKTFTGTEQVLTYCGLCTALCRDAKHRIVMIDEMGRLDAQRKGAVIGRMIHLVKQGIIHQFIGIDVADSVYGEMVAAGNELSIIKL